MTIAFTDLMLYIARTMYVDDLTYSRKGKTYRRVLLRHSYREGGKTRQRNLANLSHCSEEEILAVKFALKNKNNHYQPTKTKFLSISFLYCSYLSI